MLTLLRELISISYHKKIQIPGFLLLCVGEKNPKAEPVQLEHYSFFVKRIQNFSYAQGLEFSSSAWILLDIGYYLI